MIDEAAEALRCGELVVFPTDTVYGIGCDPFNENALEKLLEAKKRTPEKKTPILVNSIETASELVEIPHYCEDLIEKHWPGALTIVVKQKSTFPKAISDDKTVALRMPDHEDLLELITSIGGALAATSANISGKPPTLTYDEAYAAFSETARVVLPGSVQSGVSSTIVDCTGESPIVLRKGPITIE